MFKVKNNSQLLGIPLFLSVLLSFYVAPLMVWGLDQCVIYSLAYSSITTLTLPIHGTVSSLGTLFPTGMIWLAIPFVLLFKSIVDISVALSIFHFTILIICLNAVLKKLDKDYSSNIFAFFSAFFYLIFDYSLLLTAGNLWEQYVVRTLMVLLITLIFLSICTHRKIYFFLSGYLMLFVPSIHPLQAIFIPAVLILYCFLALKKIISLKEFAVFLCAAAICFLQIWLIWLINGNLLFNSLKIPWSNAPVPGESYCTLRIPLAFQEFGKTLFSPSAGTVLHLLDTVTTTARVTHIAVESKYLACLRSFFFALTLSWSTFYTARYFIFAIKPAGPSKLTPMVKGAFGSAAIYGICFLSFFVIICLGVSPFSGRPDYGGQFIGLCNFATAIGIYYLIRNYPTRSKAMRIVRPYIIAVLIATITMTVILILAVNRYVRHPDIRILALTPADEKMNVVAVITKDSRLGPEVKTYAYFLTTDLDLPAQAQPGWLTLSERFYSPHLLFDILFKRLGGSLSYVEITKNPNYVISGPPGAFPGNLERKKYNIIYQGSYLSVWKSQ